MKLNETTHAERVAVELLGEIRNRLILRLGARANVVGPLQNKAGGGVVWADFWVYVPAEHSVNEVIEDTIESGSGALKPHEEYPASGRKIYLLRRYAGTHVAKFFVEVRRLIDHGTHISVW